MELPAAYLARMRAQLGAEGYAAYLAAMALAPRRALRVNTLKSAPEELSQLLGAPLARCEGAADGFFLPEGVQPGRHPAHLAGLFYMQEPSAQTPAQLLDVRPGEAALDLCAAPGGKAGQLAAALQNDGLLVANEVSPARAAVLRRTLERLGARCAVVTAMRPDALCAALPGAFDAVLVDAPCSGEGMFRREAQAVRDWSEAAVAACAILAVGALGIIRASAAHQPAAVVALDVNPSILLTIDGGERVLKVEAKNDDARRVIDGMDLTGVPLNVAVNALIGSLLQNGYISELANSILVSVEGGDQQRAAALQERLTREIDELLAGFGVQGAVLSQTLGADDELDALAAAYDISRGKAALIQELLAQNPMLRAEDLAGLTINALGLLLSEAQPAGGVSLTGTASESGYIGADAAAAAAYAHAGVAQADAQLISVEMDVEAGRMVYEVEFLSGGLAYEYDVDAVSGEIVKSSSEDRGALTAGAADGADIGSDAALAAALAHAGVTQAQASGIRVDRDREDGRLVYDIDFISGELEYDYEIDAATGAVIKQSREQYRGASGGGSIPASSTDIGSDAALQAALAHAGVAQADATGVRVKRDRDDGRLVYDVDFYAGNAEYEYTIAAADGAVLESSRESFGGGTGGNASGGNTTGGNASGGDIGADRAQSIALGHAGLAAGDVYGLKTERDRDNGVTVYEVEFKAGGYEYDYEINASTGEILGHSREYDD